MAAVVKERVRVVRRAGRRVVAYGDDFLGRNWQRLEIPITGHGTHDRWRLHVALGQEPCARCQDASAEYWAARRRAR